MRIFRHCFALLCLVSAGAAIAAGATRKAGLWEITTTTTWQKAPAIPGAQGDHPGGGTHSTKVCLTQEMIDEDGALLPQSRGQCSIVNKVIKPGSVTGDYVCRGVMTGKGAIEEVWIDDGHAKGSVHFTGQFQVGPDLQPIEWTTESNSAFKSTDCGSVKPLAPPKPMAAPNR